MKTQALVPEFLIHNSMTNEKEETPINLPRTKHGSEAIMAKALYTRKYRLP